MKCPDQKFRLLSDIPEEFLIKMEKITSLPSKLEGDSECSEVSKLVHESLNRLFEKEPSGDHSHTARADVEAAPSILMHSSIVGSQLLVVPKSSLESIVIPDKSKQRLETARQFTPHDHEESSDFARTTRVRPSMAFGGFPVGKPDWRPRFDSTVSDWYGDQSQA